MKLQYILVLSAFLTLSCQKLEINSEQKKNKNFETEVIYDEDNRIDFFQIADPFWLALSQSTVALIDQKRLSTADDPDYLNIETQTYGYAFHLCEDEPFFAQPTAAFCSGFLVGSDIVVTAGHCIRNEYNCENVRLVFGFQYNELGSNPSRVKKEDVYHCEKVIHTEANGLTGVDFAILKLNRKVQNFSPLLLRTQGQLTLTDELTVVGYPSGLPGKLAQGGKVRDISSENFVVTTLDTYGGNSGSAVFNSNTGLIEGVLVRGDTDFVFDQEDRCRRSNVCKSTECRGEDVVRIHKIFDHLTPSDLARTPSL